ncbi:sel1 repeat family protein [bacterium]|nr:sel1 repeat family protein [bacterium]
MRIILIALSFFIATVAYCELDMDTIAKIYDELGVELKVERKTAEEYDQDLKKYQAEAKKGNAEAIYKIGRMFEAGQGSLKADIKKALTCYEKAAAKNNAAAINHLAGMYMTGHGVEADIDKALEFYKKSAQLGNSDAMCNMGILNENGIGFEENYKDAMSWYQQSAEKGNAAGMFNLGRILCITKNEAFDFKKGISWLEKAADAGSTSAMIILGNKHKGGSLGQKNNLKKAFESYLRAAEHLDRRGFRKIMELCRDEKCDDSATLALYEKMKQKTEKNQNGTSKFPDYSDLIYFHEYKMWLEGVPLLREGGYYTENYDELCAIYEDGETGCVMERGIFIKTLARWYEKNIEKGDIVSLYQLGMLHRKLKMQDEYKEEERASNDDVFNNKAIPLFEKAAEQGHVASMFQLGEVYYTKDIFADQHEKDPKKAKENSKKYRELASEWYRKAAAKGHKEAKKQLEYIKKH